jgi:hypothetical protein
LIVALQGRIPSCPIDAIKMQEGGALRRDDASQLRRRSVLPVGQR